MCHAGSLTSVVHVLLHSSVLISLAVPAGSSCFALLHFVGVAKASAMYTNVVNVIVIIIVIIIDIIDAFKFWWPRR